MDRLIARIKQKSCFKQLSDVLLTTILSNSDPKPNQIANGVLRNNLYICILVLKSRN